MSDIEILWIGEDGQWLVAEGHQDLGAFTAAADREYFYTSGLVPDYREAPSTYEDARHAYWRPSTYEECVEAYEYLQGEPNYEALIARMWSAWQEEGYMRFVSSHEDGATPITLIGTGA